jgi:hypothetical protein
MVVVGLGLGLNVSECMCVCYWLDSAVPLVDVRWERCDVEFD